MGEMNRHFDTNENPSAHWFPLNSAPLRNSPNFFPDDPNMDYYLNEGM